MGKFSWQRSKSGRCKGREHFMLSPIGDCFMETLGDFWRLIWTNLGMFFFRGRIFRTGKTDGRLPKCGQTKFARKCEKKVPNSIFFFWHRRKNLRPFLSNQTVWRIAKWSEFSFFFRPSEIDNKKGRGHFFPFPLLLHFWMAEKILFFLFRLRKKDLSPHQKSHKESKKGQKEEENLGKQEKKEEKVFWRRRKTLEWLKQLDYVTFSWKYEKGEKAENENYLESDNVPGNERCYKGGK